MEYLDFELRIDRGSERTYSVVVVDSPAGELSAAMYLPSDDPAFKDRLSATENARISDKSVRTRSEMQRNLVGPEASVEDTGIVEKFGRELFEALLPSEVRSCYRSSLDIARGQGKGLRLRLRIEAPELAALPWEYLYDTSEGDYVCLNSETPILRYLELGRPPQLLTIEPPLHILGMIASPQDQHPLDVALEKEQMATAIEHLTQAGYVTLTWLAGQTWRNLQMAMRKGPWHIFHFIGHGGFNPETGEGLVALANEDGLTDPLGATQLGRLLAGHRSMRLVFLNACEGARASETDLFSSIGAILTRRGIPAVVSMQDEISDMAALEFSRMFYDTLADGMAVDAAVTEARKAVSFSLDDSVEWGTPVLHMRSPSGRLFDIDLASAIFQDVPAVSKPPSEPHMEPRADIYAPPPIADDVRQGLLILLRKVNQFWVQGVLEKSLYQAALIDLGMEMMLGAVDNPWGTVLERPGAASQSLPTGQTISDVFDEQGGSLLILGEPGSGKTTTMLGLARDLIAHAENDPHRPIPVVFNLSAWTEPDQTLFNWLIDQLSTKYQIPKRVSRGWLEESRLLPLLDGLDEVNAELRSDCVEAINAFAHEAMLMGVVICCRLKEYIALPVRLALNAAIRLQPLTEKQVQTYMAEAGTRLVALQAILQKDSALRIEARSPLMLSLMTRTYQDMSIKDLASERYETTYARRKHLMDAYVARMFRQAGHGGSHG